MIFSRSLLLLVPLLISGCQPSGTTSQGVETASSGALAPGPEAVCDNAAAHPNDPERPSSVRGQWNDRAINPFEALEACAQAINANPGVARYQFQYGRAVLSQGNLPEAKARFRMASLGGHQLSSVYLRQLQNAQSNTLTQAPPREDPHQAFNKSIQGILTGAATVLAADAAWSRANADMRAQAVPNGASPQQCQAITRANAIRCYEKTELTSGTAVLASYRCSSRFRVENDRCEPRFNNPTQTFSRLPDYYCDPTSQSKAPSVDELVAQQCSR